MTEPKNSQEPLKSECLARFVVETPDNAVPADMIAKAERHTLDSIGAGIAGAVSTEVARLTATLAASGEGDGPTALWGLGRGMTPLNAALVTGTASHAFELDDTGGCDHSGAVVVPAAVAALDIAKREGRRVSGLAFLAAVVIGYDVARRALESCGAYEPHNAQGFHSTGTCGPFGAAAAAARILGLSVRETQMALGLASSFSGGLWACVHDGAQNKRLHAGHAAWGGLFAALLARQGFTGPAHVFEQVWGGFDKTYSPATDHPEAWTEGLGTKWKLARVSIKPHASCRSTHSSIDAVDLIRDETGFAADDVEKVEIVINPFVFGMCGGRGIHPMNSAQLSIPYCVAADLIFGSAQLENFARSRREDPRIPPMMERVVMTVDESQKDDDEPIVHVTLKDGRVFTKHVPMPLGAPTNPVTDEALLKKFRSVAGMVLPHDDVETLAANLLALSSKSDAWDALMPHLAAKPVNDGLFDA